MSLISNRFDYNPRAVNRSNTSFQGSFAKCFFQPRLGYELSSVAMNVEMELQSRMAAKHTKLQRVRSQALARSGLSILEDPEVQTLALDIRSTEGVSDDGLVHRMQSEGKIDHVSMLFVTPKLQRDTTTYSQIHCDPSIPRAAFGVNKAHHNKKTFYSDYTENWIKYKHTMR